MVLRRRLALWLPQDLAGGPRLALGDQYRETADGQAAGYAHHRVVADEARMQAARSKRARRELRVELVPREMHRDLVHVPVRAVIAIRIAAAATRIARMARS